MRIARYLAEGDARPKVGLVLGGGELVELPDATDAVAVMTDPERFADATAGNGNGVRLALADVTLLAPLEPRIVWAVGLNYRSHADEVGSAVPDEPMLFLKAPTSVTAPSGPVRRPANVEQLDYEAELGLVVGADQRIAGYVVCDDVSARDFLDDRQFTRMKSPDTFCPIGPWLTTADEVPDPYDLTMRTWVDGELLQDATTKEMLFTFEQVLDTITPLTELHPGDLIITGTPAGVGLAARPQRWLQPGQTVRIEIERLGAIEHTIENGGPR